jgi:hypothetical protein
MLFREMEEIVKETDKGAESGFSLRVGRRVS